MTPLILTGVCGWPFLLAAFVAGLLLGAVGLVVISGAAYERQRARRR